MQSPEKQVMSCDLAVVGGGIVGLATARAITMSRPDLDLVLIEAEPQIGSHQSGHNSGVIHSGLYYEPGSAKAEMCRSGQSELLEFCAAHGIAHAMTGKLVVATNESERSRLADLERRGISNGVSLTRLGPSGITDLEPNVSGVAALHVADTGIVDYGAVCSALAQELESAGVTVLLGQRATPQPATSTNAVQLAVSESSIITARHVVSCAGLWSDRFALAANVDPQCRIIPFRGEYHHLRPERCDIVDRPIYPVPDPALPFLGVHFTPMINGGVHVGPNAVPAFARAGYRWRDIDRQDLAEIAAWPGTRRLWRSHWRSGLGELHRSARLPAFVRAAQRLVPSLTVDDLVSAPAGVRAQAVARDGSMVADFAIVSDGAWTHVINAPSPAATASLAIGRHICEHALRSFPNGNPTARINT